MSRTALVTGAAGGMGTAICAALIEHGARVVLVDRDEAAVTALAAQLGGQSLPLVLDVTDAGRVDRLPELLPPEFREIDVLVNNAGHDVGGRKRFDVGSADDWEAIIQTNLLGVMRVTRSLLPGMVSRNRGDIVNMGSISALRLVPDMAPYSASKAGVHMLTDIIRGELAETAIRVTEILPGLTRTGIIRTRYRGDLEAEKNYFDQFGMALDPADVARAVMYAVTQPPGVQIAQLVILPSNRW
jgi:3-hydroxy acid dehydrogenase/malonic semialdehyde reductase